MSLFGLIGISPIIAPFIIFPLNSITQVFGITILPYRSAGDLSGTFLGIFIFLTGTGLALIFGILGKLTEGKSNSPAGVQHKFAFSARNFLKVSIALIIITLVLWFVTLPLQ